MRLRRAHDRVPGSQRAAHLGHRQRLEQRQRAADVIEVAVRDDQRIEAADAARAQVRQQHAAARVLAGRVLRAGVVEQAVPAGFDQQRHALADVEGGHGEAARQRDAPAAAGTAAARRRRRSSDAASRAAPASRRCRAGPGRTAAKGGAGALHTASGKPASQSSACASSASARWAVQSTGAASGAGSRLPRSASGVTTKLTTGIAIAFASGPDQRHLREQQQRQRHQPERDRILGARGQLQRAAPAGRRAIEASESHVQDHADRAEREPEARPQHRPGIEQHDQPERQAQDVRHARQPAHPQGGRHHGQHVERALGRHAEARQQHVQQRGDGAAERGHLLRRQDQGQLGAGEEGAPPQEGRGPRRQRRDHRDVQPGDGDQVAHAGAVEHVPVRLLDAALVADHQRDDHAGIGFARQRGEDAGAQCVAACARPRGRA